MNRILSLSLATLVALAGCSKKEEAPAAAAEAVPPAVQQPAQPAAPAQPSTAGKLVNEAVAVASQIDWTKFSWDQVASVPYSNKEQLATWAGNQAASWKDQLAKAALEQGTKSLLNMGGGQADWQKALSAVLSAVNQVKQSSPETWELARGALISAWDTFQTEANKFMGQK